MTTKRTFSQDPFLDMINDTIHSLKYVFELRIDSVHAFPADKFGNPIPFSKADWKCGAGNFDSMTYSKIWVTVCRSYKGKLPNKFIILQPAPYVHSYAFAGPSGDTTLGYIQNHPSHGDYEYSRLPSKGYPIKLIYWCYDIKPMRHKSGYYLISKFFESPMGEWGSLPRPDGTYSHERIYAMVGTKWFLNHRELADYLKQVKTLKIKTKSNCD